MGFSRDIFARYQETKMAINQQTLTGGLLVEYVGTSLPNQKENDLGERVTADTLKTFFNVLFMPLTFP